jgi:hypothetical protein
MFYVCMLSVKSSSLFCTLAARYSNVHICPCLPINVHSCAACESTAIMCKVVRSMFLFSKFWTIAHQGWEILKK